MLSQSRESLWSRGRYSRMLIISCETLGEIGDEHNSEHISTDSTMRDFRMIPQRVNRRSKHAL